MPIKFGVENNENGYETNFEYSSKAYTDNLAKMLGFKKIDEPLTAKFTVSGNTFFLKYALNINNFFYFSTFDKVWKTSVQFATKKKNIRFIDFDISPSFKLNFTNLEQPVNLYLKYANYKGSSDQSFGDYEYSQVLKSILPSDKIATGIKYEDHFDFGYNENRDRSLDFITKTFNNHLLYKLKIKYHKLINFEDAVKFVISTKYMKDINILNSVGMVYLINETHIKYSHIFNKFEHKTNKLNNPFNNGEEAIYYPHLLSTHDVNSKLIGINVTNNFKEINIGEKFFITNNLSLRFHNLGILQAYKPLQRIIEPFVGLETIFVPVFNKNLRNNSGFNKMINWDQSLKFILCCGVSLAVTDVISIDFTFKTITKGLDNLDKNLIDKFRMSFNLIANI